MVFQGGELEFLCLQKMQCNLGQITLVFGKWILRLVRDGKIH